jgi:diaminohydroxyphosphoribosylaminopyrimidine deaminase / 5-amino-6-(5-phosphoribosylamino)uracil reductase
MTDADREVREITFMDRALHLASGARRVAPPNPWVGCVIVSGRDIVGEGATRAPGEAHAEQVALAAAGGRARGATAVVTLEPCSHHGRTPPCADALVAAGVARVVVAIDDPDSRVAGRGLAIMRDAGLDVVVGVGATDARRVLAPYLWHRTTGRPYVVLKVAATLDGRVAMGDGSSQWITSPEARADAHELRADSQAVLVGAGTVRRDDPRLTARIGTDVVEPLRVVLGAAPTAARVHPCLERSGDLGIVLSELGDRGVLQLLVEGGPYTASEFVEAGLVNRVVWYIAPALAGSRDGLGALSALGTGAIDEVRRGHVVNVRRVGPDVRIEVEL